MGFLATTKAGWIEGWLGGQHAAILWLVTIGGIGLLVFGADRTVESAVRLADRLGMSKVIIGATIVSLGTTTPEMFTSVTAIASIVKGHKELLVGNIIGADILNVLFVVGLSSCAAELPVPPTFYLLHLPAMMVVLVLLRAYIFIGGESFRRWQGIPLLAVYAVYLTTLVVYAPHMAS